MIRTLGIIQTGDGLGAASAMRRLGLDVHEIRPTAEIPSGMDALLVTGPFYSLTGVLPKITQLAAKKPLPLAVWLTEQHPSPAQSPIVIKGMGSALRLASGVLAGPLASLPGSKRIVEKLAHAVRYKLCGEIAWLHSEGYLKLLAVLTPSHQAFFRDKLGVPSQVIPYGWHPEYGELLSLERDIDLLFLGSLRDRRRGPILSRLETAFKGDSIRYKIHDGSSPERKLVFGSERKELANRSKLMLSIMRQPWDDLVFRMLLAAPNGAMLISEPVIDSEPFQEGVHFASAPLERLPDLVRHYLQHPREREQLAAAAHEKVTKALTMENMAARLFQQLDL